MMDETYVHQRDVAKILTELQKEIQKVEEKYRDNPDSAGLANEIQALIDATDRDLRLKTQAIVRHRLSQSRLLPLKCPPPGKTRATSVLAAPPLPPLPDPGSRASRVRGLDDQSVPVPIEPIRFPVKRETVTSYGAPSRQRKIPDLPATLPRVDWHDPSAPVPDLPPTAIDTYGLQQLNESGHIRNSDLQKHLSGLVTVSPYTYDMPRVAFGGESFLLARDDEEGEGEAKGLPSERMDERNKVETPVEEPVGKFVFKMVDGVVDADSEVFSEFKRAYQNVWEPITIVVKMLGKLCEKFGLREQYVIGETVVEVSKMEPDTVSEEKLFECFLNQIESSRKNPSRYGFGFVGVNAERKAAIAIQSLWRGFSVRRAIRNVRKNNAAARIIQRFFRTYKTLLAFKANLAAAISRRKLAFEKSQSDVQACDTTKAHVIVHLIDTYSPGELGRVQELLNPYATLVIFSRAPLPTYIAEFLRNNVEDQARLKFLVPQQRLPRNLPIEDVLASDARTMTRIKETAGGHPIFLLPTRPQESEIELAMKMNAYVIAPIPSKADIYQAKEPARRFLGIAARHLMDGSGEVFDKASLSAALSTLAIGNLAIGQWIVKCNNGEVGWVNSTDLVLLERLKANTQVLTEKDFEDESFRQLLAQNVATDLEKIIHTINGTSTKDFLRNAYVNGAIIEEAPRQPKSAPSCAFFAAPGKEPKIVATWEKLYISLYEEFATIHPAFSVDNKKFTAKSMKLAKAASERQLFGFSVVDYWYSIRTTFNELDEKDTKLKLTPENVDFTKTERLLPYMLAEAMLKKRMDGSAYVYVQQTLVLPMDISIEALNTKCISFGVPIGEKVFFVPHLQENFIVGLVVTEQSPNRLIELVYRTLCTLSEDVFTIQDPSAHLYQYCNAIEYIKNQIDEQKEIHSTVFMKKVNIKPIERPRTKDDDSSLPPFEGKRVGTSNAPERAHTRQVTAVMSETNIFDLRKERTMITTPLDKSGREKQMMVIDEEDAP